MNMTDMRVSEMAVVVKVPLEAGATSQIQCRANCGLLFAESGVVTYEHMGKVFRSDPQHVLFVPEGITYTLRSEERSLSHVVNFRLTETAPWKTFHSFRIGSLQPLLPALNRMNRAWTFRKTSYELSCIGMLYELLAQLNEKSEAAYQPRSRYDQIARSIEYMEANFDSADLNNDLLAEASGVSTVYFRKLFTEKYGISPMRYVRQKRIEKAQALLRNGCGNISEVAMHTGYSSVYHFSKAFRMITGMTATEYLRLHAQRELFPPMAEKE